MTFLDYTIQSTTNSKILLEIDISQLNLQWVNSGAGIWKCDFTNGYPEVDPTLLQGFTAQSFSNIGSVQCDLLMLTKVSSLLLVSSTYESFYYDNTNRILYVTLPNYDEPFLHNIFLGVVHGYSKEEFTPVGSNQIYEGRLQQVPSIGYSRDPLYFGKISYNNVSVSLINADGEFDTFADTFNIYGNNARIYFGYKDLDYSQYQLMYSGYIETINISEDYCTITIDDPRKKLSNQVHYTCINKNALDALFDLLQLYSNIIYNNTFFNVAEWDIAKALAPNVTISMDTDTSTDEIINFIEGICRSCFGLFIIQPDMKYSFKMIDNSATSYTTINKYDNLTDPIAINYDPQEVVSSVGITYDKVNNTNDNGYRTILIDTSQEGAVFAKYKIYKEADFDTYLVDSSGAQAFATKILNYAKDVHGRFTENVPMKYYSVPFGGTVDVEINRNNRTILGTKKCEVLGKTYNLEEENIQLDLRIV
jgi:hypothetical protein